MKLFARHVMTGLFVLFFLLALVSCGSAPVIGAWESMGEAGSPVYQLEFKEDNTWVLMRFDESLGEWVIENEPGKSYGNLCKISNTDVTLVNEQGEVIYKMPYTVTNNILKFTEGPYIYTPYKRVSKN